MLPKLAIRGILVVFCLFFLGILFYLIKPQSAFAYSCSDTNQVGCWFIYFTPTEGGIASYTSNIAPLSPGSITMIAGLPAKIKIGSGTCPVGGPYADITFNFSSLPTETRHVTTVNLNQTTYCNYADTNIGNVPSASCENHLSTSSNCYPGDAIAVSCWGASFSWGHPSGGNPYKYVLVVDGVTRFDGYGFGIGPLTNLGRGTAITSYVRAYYSGGYYQSDNNNYATYNNSQCASSLTENISCYGVYFTWALTGAGSYTFTLDGVGTYNGGASKYPYPSGYVTTLGRGTLHTANITAIYGGLAYTPTDDSFTTWSNTQCAPGMTNPPSPQTCGVGGGTPFSRSVLAPFDWNQPSGGPPTSYTLTVDNRPLYTGATSNSTQVVSQNNLHTWSATATYGSVSYTPSSVDFTARDCRPAVDNDNVAFTFTCTNGVTDANVNLSWTGGYRSGYGSNNVIYNIYRADAILGTYSLYTTGFSANTNPVISTSTGTITALRKVPTRPLPTNHDFWKINATVEGGYPGDDIWLNGNAGVDHPSNYLAGTFNNEPPCDVTIVIGTPSNIASLPRKSVSESSQNSSVTVSRVGGWDSDAMPLGLWIGDGSAATKGDAKRCFHDGIANEAPIVTDPLGNTVVGVLCPSLDLNNDVVFPVFSADSINTLKVTIHPNAIIQNLQPNISFKVFACDYQTRTYGFSPSGFKLANLNPGDPTIVATDCVRSNAATVTVPLANLTASGLHCDKFSLKYKVGDPMTCWVTINNAVGASNPGASNVGFYRVPPDGSPNPPCPTGAGGTTNATPIAQPILAAPGLDGGTSTPSPGISATFLVGAIGPHTLYAIPNFACAAWETIYGIAQFDSLTYTVDSQAWYQTGTLDNTSGDIGSGGDITHNYIPPGQNNTNFLIAANGSMAGQGSLVKSANGWYLKNYNQPESVPNAPLTTVYNYMADHFRKTAKNPACNFTGLTPGNKLYYCASATTFSGVLPGGNNVFFVDGDLTISANLTLPTATDSAVFISSRDISVQIAVDRIDGVFIAGGAFKSSPVGDVEGSPLQINGAVYANQVIFPRSCTTTPTCNSSTPAEVINYQPRYLNVLKDLIGTPSISWTEVAP